MSRQEKRSSHASNVVALWLSAISVVITISLSCYVCIPNFEGRDVKFNFSDASVAALSVIVTLLIGWNIYSLVDIKRTTKEFKEVKDHTNAVTEEALAKAYLSIMNQTSHALEGRENNEEAYNALNNGLFAAMHFYKAGNEEKCRQAIDVLKSHDRTVVNLNNKQLCDLNQTIGILKTYKIDTTEFEIWLNTTTEAGLHGAKS